MIILITVIPMIYVLSDMYDIGMANVWKGEWNLIIVNGNNRIPDDYEVELTTLSNGEQVDSRIYPYLQNMFDDAREEGVYPSVVSGYRTGEEQQELLDEKIRGYRNEGYSRIEAERMAKKWVAKPGTSEHELGISVDINGTGGKSSNNMVYRWLSENAYKYGFIYRYPENKKEITGVINEPWHYRYVGVEAALAIHSRGICLEEYLEVF